MFKYLLSLLMLALLNSAFGQNTFRKNDVYFELLGNGIVASLNYERQLMDKLGLRVRIGVGYLSGDEKFRVSIPVGVNYLFKIRNDKSFLDAGIGGTWSGAAGLKTIKQEAAAGGRDYSEHIVSIIPSIGYRRHTKGHFMWRTNISAIVNKYRFFPWIGISVGKRL